jgi:hypothetical protein
VTIALASARTGSASGSERLRAIWRRAAPFALFVIAAATLNALVNTRYPGRETTLWFLLPSIDIVGLLVCYAALGWYRLRVHTGIHVALVAALLFVRLFRIAEGIETRYLFRTLNLYSDAQLLPELFRLLYTTLSTFEFLLAAAAIMVFLVGIVAATSYALRYCERFLRERRHAAFFAIAALMFVILSPLLAPLHRRGEYPSHYFGAFAASVLPRLGEEADFILHVHGYRVERLSEIRRVQAELAISPNNLKGLAGSDLLLFVVESYGATVRERPLFVERLQPIYDAFDSSLQRAGFAAASSLLDSPTYGGSSWLAHATLATGVRTENQFQYSLLKTAAPKTLAGFFSAAGYRTVLVQPATTRPLPGDGFHGFEHCYFAAAFDYKGPSFAYAPMPDQYVIDFIDRRERMKNGPPRFIEFALVSSHLPWTEHARIIDDWAQIGDGAIYENLEKVRFSTWLDVSALSEGYAHSIAYDLDVLRRYVVERIADESLIIIIGDHQPAAQVTMDSPDNGVPIHVISRNRSFVKAFLARGYTRGMRPDPKRPRSGMEAFLPAFLRDFSSERVQR